MSYYISVKDGDVVKEYRVPSFDEFTIAEWVRLCLPENTEQGQAQLMEEVKRMTGIPLKALRRLPMGEFDRMCDAYVALRTEAALRQNEVGGVDFANPSTIEHKGVTYAVPTDLARDTITGQWVDLIACLEGKTHEPEVMEAICGRMLVPVGQQYDGPVDMNELPVRVAMGLTAFFLGRSERLKTLIAEHSRRRLMSLLHAHGLVVPASTTPTA